MVLGGIDMAYSQIMDHTMPWGAGGGAENAERGRIYPPGRPQASPVLALHTGPKSRGDLVVL